MVSGAGKSWKHAQHVTCNFSFSALNEIRMAGHLPKPDPAHLDFTKTTHAEGFDILLIMHLDSMHKMHQAGLQLPAGTSL